MKLVRSTTTDSLSIGAPSTVATTEALEHAAATSAMAAARSRVLILKRIVVPGRVAPVYGCDAVIGATPQQHDSPRRSPRRYRIGHRVLERRRTLLRRLRGQASRRSRPTIRASAGGSLQAVLGGALLRRRE